MEERKVRKSGWIALTAMAAFGLFAGPSRAADDVQKCEAAKNKVAGKYYFCREKAEAKAILTGDPTDYTKCTTRFDEKWDFWENAVPGACPDNVALTSDMNTYIADQAAEAAAILSGAMDVPGCGDDQTNVVGEQCDGSDLGGESCTSLGFGGGTLACTSCALDTSACTCAGACTGSAAVADVLVGKTFSNSSMTGLIGTMPDNGAQTIIPGTSNQAIAAGYHNGSGYCAGDAGLVSGNIKSGTSLFGVAGSSKVVDTSAATAVAADLVSGRTCYANGNLITAAAPSGSHVNGGDGLKVFTIPNGFYVSKTATANDSDLVPANIKSGTTIFGVTGAAWTSQPKKTGQTTTYGTGSDGDLEIGISRSYADNGDGTITDDTTGLMWEKKSDDGSIHDKDNTYTWGLATSPYTMNSGTMVTTFLDSLNGGVFAGYADWRIPNRFELGTLANLQNTNPAMDSAFNSGCVAGCGATSCSCTLASTLGYWSSTTYANNASQAWIVSAQDGSVGLSTKSSTRYVRAVRGGP